MYVENLTFFLENVYLNPFTVVNIDYFLHTAQGLVAVNCEDPLLVNVVLIYIVFK